MKLIFSGPVEHGEAGLQSVTANALDRVSVRARLEPGGSSAEALSHNVKETRAGLDDARDIVEQQFVILDKLGSARRLVGAIQAIGDAVGDVSVL